MNILFISALEGGKYSGPLYSVPRQIKTQSKIDNVYWINLTKIETSNRFDKGLYNFCEFWKFDIEKLPAPFNKPDIIVFEEFFKIECCIVARKLEKYNIPYIIIPRCQMTKKYLKNKRLKKIIANIILFKHFAKKASAVQFLSNQEMYDSIEYYKGVNFIIPNGIDIPKAEIRNDKNNFNIIGTFIGRYSIWQKGLDLLIEAVSKKEKEIKEANIKINLYGPSERTGTASEILKLVEKFGVTDIITVNDSVFDEEKKEVLKNSNFFIHTSRFEGLPMSILEALSYGIPCLVTQGSNLRDDVREYNAGWTADDLVESIEDAIQELIKDINKMSTKSENALKLAQKYSWDNIANQTHNCYINLLNGENNEKNI